MPALSIIIINYNTADFLTGCLRSVYAEKGVSCEVLVVDNASRDDSVGLVRQNFTQVHLIASDTNLGFARANNRAAQAAAGRYLFFLNPDTVVRPGCLAAIIEFMDTHPEIGLAGTTIRYPDQSIQGSVEMRYPGQRHAGSEVAGLPGQVAWLLGASLVIRAEVFTKVGGFSEEFFLYGEDVELGFKIRKAGWALGLVPQAEIIHWEGMSERGSQPIEVWRKKLTAETIFYRKHYQPQTVARICRANIRQARWRLFTLGLQRLLGGTETERKRSRYRLNLEIFRELAAEVKPRHHLPASRR